MMRFPDKITSYSNSDIARFPAILSLLEEKDLKPQELVGQLINSKRHSAFSNARELCAYWNALDCLFYLGKVTLDEERCVLCYVKDDTM